MDISELPEPLRTRAAELISRPPIEKVRSFLHGYVEDAEDVDEVRRELRSDARRNTFFLQQDLAALEAILAEPQVPGTLLRLVEFDANWGIDHDQTDHGAAVFLRQIAQLVRDVIEDAERAS